MSDMSDDSGEVYMSTLATLDNPIRDEYDRDEMDNLDNVVDKNPDAEIVLDQIIWDHPSFTDISAWEIYQQADENRYSILNRVEFRVRKSDTTKLVLECQKHEEGCPWRLRVVVMQRTTYWTVRKYGGDHISHNNSILQSNIHLNAHFIAREMRNAMDANMKFSTGQIRNLIERDYGYQISYWKAWKAQQKVLVYFFCKWDESFSRLPHLMQPLQDSSPNNFVKWDVTPLDDGTMQVNRIFWAFSECILAFKHCRPILSIDGTHMYEKYNVKLLVAIGLDANNRILPLSFALVESKNTSRWKWCMSCIREGVTQREGLCVVSDRHAGILAAMREPEWREPNAYHHFQSNFMTKVKDDVLKAKLGHVAYAKELKFKNKFRELLQLLHDKPLAHKWLEDMNVELWTQAFDYGGFRWGNKTMNASECLNKILKNGRDFPVSSLVMYTFKQIAAYFIKRSQSPYNNEGECFHRKFMKVSRVFDVLTRKNHITYKVCLDTRTCQCRKWTLFKYPCLHAMTACKAARVEYSDYVPIEYTLKAYYRTWSYFSTPYITRIFGVIMLAVFMFRINDSNVTKLADPKPNECVTRFTSDIGI
ncbi:hypothetical protein QQ045_001927 [Rhodiola kirilowii]